MALSKEQWEQISAASAVIRGLGCAVCIFTPDDVEDMIEADEEAEPPTDFDAADWLNRWRSKVEDRMSEQGNETLGIYLNMDGVL